LGREESAEEVELLPPKMEDIVVAPFFYPFLFFFFKKSKREGERAATIRSFVLRVVYQVREPN
jgi:hypothetical protein